MGLPQLCPSFFLLLLLSGTFMESGLDQGYISPTSNRLQEELPGGKQRGMAVGWTGKRSFVNKTATPLSWALQSPSISCIFQKAHLIP